MKVRPLLLVGILIIALAVFLQLAPRSGLTYQDAGTLNVDRNMLYNHIALDPWRFCIETDIGVTGVRIFPFATRTECNDEKEIEALRRADGVFLTGGNQLRLSTGIGGTSAAYALREMSAR